MPDTDLAFAPAYALLALMDEGALTSQELTRLYIDRIKTLNPRINALAARNFEQALEQARRADEARARGDEPGPLHGLPMTIKDALESKDLLTTSGAPEYKTHVPQNDAVSVARLRKAGAIILAKTNTPYMSGDWQAFNAIYGTTSNPWDTARTPGGSSGGAAAAISAGLTGADIGSDIGGSIRLPAHFCGIFGHKPSFGLVSSRGHIPGRPGSLLQADLTVIGPLARAAKDLELILKVLAAPMPGERAFSLRLPPARAKAPKGLRVAVWADDEFSPVDAHISAAVMRCAGLLREAGARVDFEARPALDFAEVFENYALLMHAQMTADFPAKIRASLARRAGKLDEDDKTHAAMQARGAALSHAQSSDLKEQREKIKAIWARFFENHDVLLCPPANVSAFAHEHNPDFWAREISVNGQPRPYGDLMHWASLATGAHLPATAAPLGLAGGLPVGVQIIGPYQEDLTPIAVAGMIEELNGGFTAPPDFT
jgi:amidase